VLYRDAVTTPFWTRDTFLTVDSVRYPGRPPRTSTAQRAISTPNRHRPTAAERLRGTLDDLAEATGRLRYAVIPSCVLSRMKWARAGVKQLAESLGWEQRSIPAQFPIFDPWSTSGTMMMPMSRPTTSVEGNSGCCSAGAPVAAARRSTDCRRETAAEGVDDDD
jgi:hypothetical protein